MINEQYKLITINTKSSVILAQKMLNLTTTSQTNLNYVIPVTAFIKMRLSNVIYVATNFSLNKIYQARKYHPLHT